MYLLQTLLSMGIFNFDFNDGQQGKLSVSKQAWLFPAIAGPLTLITLGLSYCYTVILGRRRRMRAVFNAYLKEDVVGTKDPTFEPPIGSDVHLPQPRSNAWQSAGPEALGPSPFSLVSNGWSVEEEVPLYRPNWRSALTESRRPGVE